MATKLTAQNITTLQCPAAKTQHFYPDTGKGSVFHLKLRVTRSTRAWVWEGVAAVDGERKTIRRPLGDVATMSLDDAREAAQKLNRSDAKPAKANDQCTFGQVLDAWFESKRLHWSKGTAKCYGYIKDDFDSGRLGVVRDWRERLVADFKRAGIEHAFHHIAERRGKSAAGTWIAVVRGVFGYAIANEWIEKNPARMDKHGVHGIQSFDKAEYVADLDEVQIAALDAGIASFPEPLRSYYRLLRLCGCRKSELQKMKWEQVNLAACTMKFVHTPETPRKNKKAYVLLLDDESMSILRRLPSRDKSPYLFPSPYSSSCHMGVARFQDWTAMLKRAGLPFAVGGQGGVHIHIMRHLFVDERLAEGVPPQDVADMIGDTLEVVMKVYRKRNILDAQRRALELRRIKLNQPRAIETTLAPVTVTTLLSTEDVVADDELAPVI